MLVSVLHCALLSEAELIYTRGPTCSYIRQDKAVCGSGSTKKFVLEKIMSYLSSPVETWSTYGVQISWETENVCCAASLCNPFSTIP